MYIILLSLIIYLNPQMTSKFIFFLSKYFKRFNDRLKLLTTTKKCH